MHDISVDRAGVDHPRVDRRRWLALAGALGGVAVAARAAGHETADVPAAEDLMREHGVLRRGLLVYAEAAARLQRGADVPMNALRDTAALFRSFGEDYHERSLEERHVFPALAKSGGETAKIVRTLSEQHERGRLFTDYVSRMAQGRGPGAAGGAGFAAVLAGFVRMYQHHAAIEDTVIFPAWKAAISRTQYAELTEDFEALEHKMFGKDGFDDAVERIAAIERELGLADLASVTIEPPPRS
jgi:hemerythrin-like domain-containing protein